MPARSKPRSTQGPALPSKLNKELSAADTHLGARNERVSKAFAIADRKAQRKLKRQQKGQQRHQFTQKQHQNHLPASPPVEQHAGQKRKAQARQQLEIPTAKQARPSEHAKSVPNARSKERNNSRGAGKAAHKTTKFDELVEPASLIGQGQQSIAAELAFQQHLAKQLGLKGKNKTKAKGPDDGLDDLLEGISAAEAVSPQTATLAANSKKRKAMQASGSDGTDLSDQHNSDSESDGDLNMLMQDSESASEQTSEQDLELESELDSDLSQEMMEDRQTGMPAEPIGRAAATPVEASSEKYIPPAARAAAQATAGGMSQLQRRMRGLLNRMSDSNLPGIVADVLQLAEQEGERAIADAVTAELLQAAAEGPRASERFAAVVAAFMSGLTGTSDAQGIGANFTSALAARLDKASQQDQSLTCANLASVLAHLYTCGLLPASTMYSFLDHLTQRFAEGDVATMLTLLQSCGLQLRSDDSVSMKDFVVAVHARAAKAGSEGGMSQRAEIMLSLVLDIKNNKRRDKASGPTAVLSPAVVTWLKQCHVGHVQLKGLTWKKLLTSSKKGLWWMPSITDTDSLQPMKGNMAMTALEDSERGPGGAELLKLAAAQRMSTDARRAAFCVVMGSEDYIDASDRLLRLPLKGESEREVVRVTVECCLQERSWNPYYSHLLQRLLASSKAHRVTLQYCLWDQFKLVDQTDMRRLINLAHLTAQLIASFTLSATILKVVEFSTTMTARSMLLWRITFRHMLSVCKDNDSVQSVFSRIAGQEQLEEFRASLLTFLRLVVGPWLAEEDREDHQYGNDVLQRLRLAEVALKSNI
ncbi:TPA: hypothetical protein ACH3X2_011953 [Trebouxia sp. C0005]|nr:MAG: hypothetical protein FRX49_02212 [Trebouxia sp. A1-2]